MEQLLEETFLDHFRGLEDPRSERNRLYSMEEILIVSLCAVICGAEGWKDVETFGIAKLDHLRKFCPFENGSPSDDTFRRFFRNLNPEKFQEMFRKWVESLQLGTSGKVIAIDGKSSRHSFDEDGNMLHMISAYATEARLVLGQKKVSNKSNEITAIPELLKCLDLKGATVTIDAMGAQYKIANEILSRGGEYIFSLKGNQSSLHRDVKLFFENPSSSISTYTDCDKGHGRIETRHCSVCNNVGWLRENHPNWKSMESIVKVDSVREIKGDISNETRYYISASNKSAQQILTSIRSHWAIENSLHWILDMSLDEDKARVRKKNAPQNMAIVRHLALNLLQLAKKQIPKQHSIKQLRKLAGWKSEILFFILKQTLSN